MSRRTEKRKYGKYNKFDVVYADFGKNPHGIQGGIRPGIIISCDASNHDGAPQALPNYGYSTAVGLFKGLVGCFLVLVCNWASKKTRGRGIV